MKHHQRGLLTPVPKHVLLALLLGAGIFTTCMAAEKQPSPGAVTALDRLSIPGRGIESELRLASAGIEACNKAMATLFDAPRRSTTAAERYRGALELQQCIAIRKANDLAEVASQLQGDAPRAFATANLVAERYRAMELEVAPLVSAAKAESEFMGMTFGVGVGVSNSSKERVSAAEVAADGTVRVTSSTKQEPRVILEAHYYGLCRTERCNDGKFGIGPFFGLAATENKIDSFALGLMFGWKDAKLDANGGFSIGIGAVLDREVQQLAAGFEEGRPLPAGETAVKFETRSRWAPVLFFTRTF
jgi:hypothetical protein